MEQHKGWTTWLRRRTPPPQPADVLAAVRAGFAVAPAAWPAGFGCSCDRVGCPAPGMHPISLVWQQEASADERQVLAWLRATPDANFITPTGRTHDVLDVPASAGEVALERMDAEGVSVGPVAAYGAERYLFFTATRGTPADEDEWWPCVLDCVPEQVDDHPGLRWHCRGSYVLTPPSTLPGGERVRWVRGPELPLPDPVRMLDQLTTACEVLAGAGGEL